MSVKKNLTVSMIYSFMMWYKNGVSNNDSLLNCFDNLPKWHIRQNYNSLQKIGADFEEVLNEERDKIVSNYLSDEKSNESENGGRIVKPEYMDQYTKDMAKLEELLNPILLDVKEVSIETLKYLDIENAIERYSKDLNNTDMDMLSLFME